MRLRRLFKLLVANFMGQGITVLNQLLVPPFFLHFYANGLETFGEWIALSASVNYLGTLNYGVQTYANNEMTIRYNRGEVDSARAVHGSAFRLLMALMASFIVLGLAVFFLPITSWLRLRYVSAFAASLTLYLLILQIALNMIYSLLTNSYMAVGKLDRGAQWTNAQRTGSVLTMAAAVVLRAGFPVLAGVQLIVMFFFTLLILADMRRVAPILVPSLRYGSWGEVKKILMPSGHFGLIAIAGFLTWQGPVILIQRVLGPSAVAVFALVRTVFQMSRQILSIASSIIAQDITELVGRTDWKLLRRLYDMSERVVLFLIPVMSVGSLLLCPFLFTVWLHKRALYQPVLCILMAVVSAVLGIKEHKTQFQSSSNAHERLSVVVLSGYTVMLLVSVFAMRTYGLTGFMVAWLVWEVVQTAFVLRLNKALFPPEFAVSLRPVGRLTVFMLGAFAVSLYPALHNVDWALGKVVLLAVAITAVLSAIAWYLFDMDELRVLLLSRMRARFVPAVAAAGVGGVLVPDPLFEDNSRIDGGPQ